MKINSSILIVTLLSIVGAWPAFDDDLSLSAKKVSALSISSGISVTSKIKDEECFAKIKAILIQQYGPHIGDKLFELPLDPKTVEGQQPTWPSIGNFGRHYLPKAIAEIQTQFQHHVADAPCLLDDEKGSFENQIRHSYLGYSTETHEEIKWILRLKDVSFVKEYLETRRQILTDIVDSLIDQYKTRIKAEESAGNALDSEPDKVEQ